MPSENKTLSFRELADKILALTPKQQALPAKIAQPDSISGGEVYVSGIRDLDTNGHTTKDAFYPVVMRENEIDVDCSGDLRA